MRYLTTITVIVTTLLLSIFGIVSTVKSATHIVVLDPGHSGTDTGAVYKDLQEKNVTLDIAFRTKNLLEGAGYSVYLTRTDDSTKTNNDRYTFANSVGADVLVSIHLNGSKNHSYDGTQGLYGKLRKDKALTDIIHQALVNKLTVPDRGLTNFASGVLLKSKMPATMQETVYLTSDYEYNLLTDGTGNRQQQIAQALFEGINNWFK